MKHGDGTEDDMHREYADPKLRFRMGNVCEPGPRRGAMISADLRRVRRRREFLVPLKRDTRPESALDGDVRAATAGASQGSELIPSEVHVGRQQSIASY